MPGKKPLNLDQSDLDRPLSFRFATTGVNRVIYAWEQLFDGQRHVLRRKRDFHGSLKSMRDQIHISAKRWGVRVSVRRFGESLAVTREK